LRLRVLDGSYAVCRLGAATLAPPPSGRFWSLTHAGDERSLVCVEEDAPVTGGSVQRGFRILEVEGPLDFSLTGVTASLALPLAQAGVPIVPIATHDTDYVLVPGDRLGDAIAALADAGHDIVP
jgi:uncharacterized protein